MSKSRAFSLIEILVVIALMAALGAGLFSFYAGKGGEKMANGKRHVTPKSKAYDTVCQSNLNQVRLSIKTVESTDTDGGESKHPASLTELKLPSDFLACPDGHEKYTYDSVSGEVHCPHFGHEKL